MSIRFKVSVTVMIVLTLIAGCGKSEPPVSATPLPPTETPIPPTATLAPPTLTLTQTPIPPTDTPLPPTATPAPPTAVPPTTVATSSPAAITTSVPPTNTAVLPTRTNAPALAVISVDTVDRVELLHTLDGHSDRIIALAFSGDGVYVASSSQDKTIKLWEVASGQEMHTFGISEVCMNDIAFSPDGNLLASSEAIWDVESKQVVHTLERADGLPWLSLLTGHCSPSPLPINRSNCGMSQADR